MKSIQILGLRPYYDHKKKKHKLKHEFFDQNWRAGSILEILSDPDKILEQVPEGEQYNLFMTMANCGEGVRQFAHQTVMTIDIDHVGTNTEWKVFEGVCALLGLSPALTGLVKSGNGIHMYIALDEPIESVKYFEQNRAFYAYMCRRINDEIERLDLKGYADESVFEPRRLMRLPGTINDKEKMLKTGLPTRCEVLQKTMEPQGFDLKRASGLPEVQESEAVKASSVEKFGTPDHEYINKECLFLKSCLESPEKITEPQWYAMLSIVGHYEKGQEWAHKFSQGHPDYDKDDTDEKLEQAMAASGPRTCQNINSIWSGCNKCPHFRKCKSPILLKGEDYIATEKTGFKTVTLTAAGNVVTRISFGDLCKYIQRLHNPVFINETQEFYYWNGKYYEKSNATKVKNFCEYNVKGDEVKMADRNEFLDKVKVRCLKSQDWFEKSTIQKINFENGVYDMEKGELLEHNKKYAFLGVMPFKHDPEAKAPLFEKFLDEVTEGNKEVQKLLLEYSGYCLSGDDTWLQQLVILLGSGANGKSVFVDLLQSMVGDSQATGYNIDLITTNDNARFSASKALFNACGESDGTLTKRHCSMLKDLTTGGKVPIKKLYADVETVYFKTKLLFSWNEIPNIHDNTPAFKRRLLIVPFNRTFTESEQDPDILNKLKEERSGIFNLMISAYKKLKASGKKIKQPQIVKDAVTTVTNQSDILYMFAKEHLQKTDSDDDFVTKTALYGMYSDFCENNKYNPMGKIKFMQRFEAKFHMTPIRDTKRRSKTTGKHGFSKLKLVNDESNF